MEDFPEELCGLWIDEDGKAVYITKLDSLKFKAAIITNLHEQLENEPIHIDEHLKRLTTRWIIDESRNVYRLQIEAGWEFVGPTYNLYVSKIGYSSQDFIFNIEDLEDIRLIPEVQMGLYDDYEDDLGVPWGFPYKNFQKASAEIEERFKELVTFNEDGTINS